MLFNLYYKYKIKKIRFFLKKKIIKIYLFIYLYCNILYYIITIIIIISEN